MQPLLARYAARPVPRYTSYPTAPHFSSDFPEAVYRDWLRQLDPDEPISLYLHVPFCAQMCWYCGCNMKLAARYEPVAEYVAALSAEIDLLAAALPASMRVAHLHWGGGTPTTLTPDDLAGVMARLARHFRFDADAELAVESDPRTLSDAMIGRLGELGFTRASLGVQEFDPKVQAAINRIQPFEMVARASEGLRAAGVGHVNFDLIYGLPYQTTAALSETVRQSLTLAPDRIALFGYAHVPWVAKNQRMIPTEALPGADERAEQAETAAGLLVAAGYRQIGIDHFARPEDSLAVAAASGRLHRNFQGYTSDTARTLIGLGATSIGRLPQGYAQNIAETGAWSRAIAAGRFPVARGHVLRGEDALRARVIERIMCDGAVDLTATGQTFGRGDDWWAAERDALADLEREGVIVLADGQLRLTADGARLARVVAACFDAYLAASATRHSVAV